MQKVPQFAGKSCSTSDNFPYQVLCKVREIAPLSPRNLASLKHPIPKLFHSRYSLGLLSGPISKILLLLVLMGPFASPADRTPPRTKNPLVQVVLREEYQISIWNDCATVKKYRETLSCGHVFLANAWVDGLTKRRRCRECAKALRLAASLPPKKPVEAVREVIPEKKEA